METTYITLKQAEQLKKLKFDGDDLIREGNTNAYGEDGKEVNWTTNEFHCWKPTLDYACKWLRENYDIHITPHVSYNMYGIIYMCGVIYVKDDRLVNILLKDKPLTIDCVPPQIFDTFELAQSAGFDFAMDLINKTKLKKQSKKDKEQKLKKIEKLKKAEKKRLDEALSNIKKLNPNKVAKDLSKMVKKLKKQPKS